MFGPVSSKYFELVDQGSLQEDPEQVKCVLSLDELYSKLHKPYVLQCFQKPFPGRYLVGAVGRGKTHLMDLFFFNREKI